MQTGIREESGTQLQQPLLQDPVLYSGGLAPRPLTAQRASDDDAPGRGPAPTDMDELGKLTHQSFISYRSRTRAEEAEHLLRTPERITEPVPLSLHAHPASHHHTSVTHPTKESDQPPPPDTPACINPVDIDFTSPEGQLLAQLAGGAWVSQVLLKLWPQLRSSIEHNVQEMTPSLVDINKPTWLEGVTLDRFSLGPNPPVIRSVHIDPTDDDDVEEVRMRLEMSWDSQSDMQLTISLLPESLAKKLPSLLAGMANYITSLTLGVQHLVLRAQLLLALGPLDPLKVIRQAQISLLRTPDVDFTLTVTKGESKLLNVVKPWLSTTIAAAFGPFVLPEHISYPLELDLPDVHKPEGILLVRVLNATHVPKMDLFGHSDTYVDVWVRGRLKHRTPVIKNSADPVWDADNSFKFLVHTRQYQTLSFELWDEDNDVLDAHDDLIGGASLRLSDLPIGEERTLTLQVVNASCGTISNEAPPGVDPAYAGGTSKVDVTNTRLQVACRYIPARLAHMWVDEVGTPGTLMLKLTKVTIPDLRVLDLKARIRPYVTGQQAPTMPPVSPFLTARRDKDPETGEELKDRKDIPFLYDAVWDIMGAEPELARAVFVLEVVTGVDTRNELIISRVEVPLNKIRARQLANFSSGSGGKYTLKSATDFEFELELLWYPLLREESHIPSPGAHPTPADRPGLQGLLDEQPGTTGVSAGIVATAKELVKTAKADAQQAEGKEGSGDGEGEGEECGASAGEAQASNIAADVGADNSLATTSAPATSGDWVNITETGTQAEPKLTKLRSTSGPELAPAPAGHSEA